MELHDITRERGNDSNDVLRRIPAKALFVGITSDILYLPQEIEQASRAVPHGMYATLDAPFGHDSFLVAADALAELLSPFVNEREPAVRYNNQYNEQCSKEALA
jgi:homoserine O-acetyltransferase